MRKTLIALLAVLAFGAHAQQRNFDAVQIKTTQVAEGIYMLEGEGGNIGVSSGEDGVFLIDDQFAPLTPKILAAVKAMLRTIPDETFADLAAYYGSLR